MCIVYHVEMTLGLPMHQDFISKTRINRNRIWWEYILYEYNAWIKTSLSSCGSKM